MSGHSKWAGIKRKKAVVDAKRGKLFSKLIKEIVVAVKLGGSDLEGNSRLRLAILKAKDYNMPIDNIKRAIQKATGESSGETMPEEVIYEGYGAGGVAILVEAMTDNKNRTTSNIRNIFSKRGGSLGESGCVSWMFNKKGYLAVNKDEVSEEKLLDIITEAGAEDYKVEKDAYEVYTDPSRLEIMRKILEENKIKIELTTLSMIPRNYLEVDKSTALQLLKLIESLDEDDDVQQVFSNFNIPDEILREIEEI
ncbi:YebC/PmpR family DNA-binding transcriptional regulator [bacterium]|nr:YebC/PmpR family DNA-binding transcriptional regulator [bacterium]MBU1153378.1 YebC/PmpR family DNA-binding transcriptional regulator [bacterium]MBU2599262.1 YebC/PmpR family DNA-binding transcriptional regulator [bacterium]